METLLSDTSRQLAGILFLALVTVETGGLYMLKIVRGREDLTPFQEKFARAGRAARRGAAGPCAGLPAVRGCDRPFGTLGVGRAQRCLRCRRC